MSMSDMRRIVPLFLVLIMMGMPVSNVNWLEESTSLLSPSNPTGVDVRVIDVAVSYTTSGDEENYRMFSSNHPILGFNRPAELYVIDSMVNVSTTLTVTVENIGSASSGVIDVNVLLLHNEYAYFEFVNTTVQMASLSPGGSNTANLAIIPTYAGNHTLVMRATSTVSDDVPSNDAMSRGFAVGYEYFNCDATTQWTVGSGWTLSTDTSISKGRSCHAGNGQTSTYNNNALSIMTTPVMDLSDAISNPLRTNGLSFYYTGSTLANDKLTVYGINSFGAWSEIGSITGTIDQDFLDGANWNTFSVNNKGAASPLLPVAADLFHSSSQFKFEFTSDASGTDIGFYIDEIVILYDQKVRMDDYNVSAQGTGTNGAIPGEWGSISIEILNTGNISEYFIPEILGLPTGWEAYYARPSGTSLDPLEGLMAIPGTPTAFQIMIKPEANASIGFQQMSVSIRSMQYSSISTVVPVQFLVMADRIPVIIPPSIRPSCPPSYTCTFEVGITNHGDATDVFDVSFDTSSLPSGWSVGLAWSQSSSVLLRPDDVVNVLMTMTIPATAAPDTIVDVEFTLTSQNDTSRVATVDVPISASMISDASVMLISDIESDWYFVDAGESVVLEYMIWNNATRQDIFAMSVLVENAGQWTVHQPTRPDAVLNSGMSTTFEVVIDVPHNAIANDRGPTITPVIESQRSLMTVEGDAFDGMRVSTTHDVVLSLGETPTKLTPSIPNAIELIVENRGNGPTQVEVNPMDLPETWTWWLTIDDEPHTGPIDLSVSYDLMHIENVTLWVMLPMTEAAGELHSMSIEAVLMGEGNDINPDDNSVEVLAATGAVRQPSLGHSSHSSSTMANGLFFAETVLFNDGNAVENRLSVMATVSSSPPTVGLIPFFTIDGGQKAMGSEIDIIIAASSNVTLRVEVIVPADAPLNTQFVVRFDVLGAVDDENLPIVLVDESMILLDQQRSMVMTAAASVPGIVNYGTAASIWVNHTSSSTITEQYTLTTSAEEGWQVTCDKRLVNSTGIQFEATPGHVTPQFHQKRCEVLNLNGPLEGDVSFVVSSGDGELKSTQVLTLMFEAPPDDEPFGSAVMVGGSIGVFAFIALLVFMLRGKREETESLDMDDHEYHKEVAPIAGPPTSDRINQTNSPAPAPVEQSAHVPNDSGVVPSGPPLPESGLPAGWTEEQWTYYGQQYLDGTL